MKTNATRTAVSRLTLAFAAGIIMCPAFTSCSKSSEGEGNIIDSNDEIPRVQLDVANIREVPQIKEYTASIEAFNTNNIAPSVPNRIKSINVQEGDRVAKGQVLVVLDKSNIDQLKVNIDQIEREYNRALELLKIGAGTQQAVDQLKAQLDAARTQYNNLAENTVLTSPISGVVTARNYDPGDMTGGLPVLTVGQLSPVVKVMVNPSENDITAIKKGMNVEISFDAFPGETFDGKVSRIYPTVDAATRTFPVEVQVSNPKERILPGMFARVTFNMGSQNNIVVPDRAVVKQSGSGNRYVYVYRDGKVDFKQVELGQRLDDAYEIISGLQDGDSVVITGQTRLADGIPVQVVK